MIKDFIKLGSAVKKQDKYRFIKTQQRILEYYQNISHQQPRKVFITFVSTESVEILKKMQKREKKRACCRRGGDVIKIKEAPLPTNIKWEHRARYGLKKYSKIILTLIIAVLIMVMTNALIFYFRLFLQRTFSPYRQIDCEETFKEFGPNLEGVFKSHFEGNDAYFEGYMDHRGDLYNLSLSACYCSARIDHFNDAQYKSIVKIERSQYEGYTTFTHDAGIEK